MHGDLELIVLSSVPTWRYRATQGVNILHWYVPCVILEMERTQTRPGTAIYVDCILAKSTSNPPLNGHSDMRFFIDGALVGRFARDISNDSTSTYEYGTTVYANTSIPTGLHTFRLQNGHTNSTTQSLVLLDAITYS